MNVMLAPVPLNGTIRAIPSKSHVHRLLICAALADRSLSLPCRVVSNDIRATISCLNALGAHLELEHGGIAVVPIRHAPSSAELDPGESGSTYRFFTPLAAALGVDTRFTLHGKLPSRPMDDLWREMEAHGVTIAGKGTEKTTLRGKLTPGEYRLSGGVSSQFFSGLLFALPLLDGDSRIVVTDHLESAGYVEMTLAALTAFGVRAAFDGTAFSIPGNQKYTAPVQLCPEGDWSNSAFWLCAAAARGSMTVTGLSLPSRQGDSAVVEILRRFGADVTLKGDALSVSARPLRGVTVDVGETPDLVPALAVAAVAATGQTVLENAGRLRLKESDRIATVCAAVNALGGCARDAGDAIVIEGGAELRGGVVDASGDHRIAMLGAMLAAQCREPVTILGAQAADKSYPGFFDDVTALGGIVTTREA